MGESEQLSHLELLVLSGTQRLEPEAFVQALLGDLRKHGGRATSARTLYAVVARLEQRGLLTFRYAGSASPTGGARKIVRLTAAGREVLRHAVEGRARVSRMVRAILDGPNHSR